MRKNLGKKALIAPAPVFMMATYDENGNADVMNIAWGGQCGPAHIAFNLSHHKSTENLEVKKEFTVSLATKNTELISDYFGVVSGKDEDKIAKSGVHTHKSEFVDAPIIDEYPITMECKVVSMKQDELTHELRVVGEVVNLNVDESVLDENGNVDLGKAGLISFDGNAGAYREVGAIVGKAFSDGMQLKNK